MATISRAAISGEATSRYGVGDLDADADADASIFSQKRVPFLGVAPGGPR